MDGTYESRSLSTLRGARTWNFELAPTAERAPLQACVRAGSVWGRELLWGKGALPHGGLAEWSARCGGADVQSDNTWSPIAIFGPQAPRGRPYQEVEVGSIFRNADTAELVMISASSPLPFFCVRPACLAAAAGGESKGCVWVRRGADGMICCEKQKGKLRDRIAFFLSTFPSALPPAPCRFLSI